MSTSQLTVVPQQTQARRRTNCRRDGILCRPGRRCDEHRRDPQVAQALHDASVRHAQAVLRHSLAVR